MRRLRNQKAASGIFGKSLLLLMLLSLVVSFGDAQQIGGTDQGAGNEKQDDRDRFNGWLGHAHDVQHTGVSLGNRRFRETSGGMILRQS